MCVYSAKIETLAALPKGGVILTSQLQCLNEARRLGKAGVHSGDCKEGCSWLSHQLGRTADLKCLPSASKWPGGSSDRTTSAAAVKSLQSCPTPCDPIDGSPPGSSVPRILQARILEWVAISFSNACMHAKSLQSGLTLWPYGQQPTRLLCPWDSPGKNTGVGCHVLLKNHLYHKHKAKNVRWCGESTGLGGGWSWRGGRQRPGTGISGDQSIVQRFPQVKNHKECKGRYTRSPRACVRKRKYTGP